ncbi:MAG: phosphatase PAP2 family protein [Tannerella sp.]|jgi:undecaprenyl-diphosphatase|nr:phosphatase PAP2 family protein [Tannerella sp.]
METILEYERDWFLWLNNSHTPFLDDFIIWFAGAWIWLPTVLVPLYFVWKDRKHALPVFLGIVAVVVLGMLLPAFVIKPIFARFRPITHPDFKEHVMLLNDIRANGLYGFVSGHASTAFSFAVFTLLIIRKYIYSILILIWALLIGYSRIYMGAHFISDVIGGIIVGILLGWATYALYKRFTSRKLTVASP